ncbi:MAG: DUF748 domain-containing protein [Candidatus Saccharibacteria bacterium]
MASFFSRKINDLNQQGKKHKWKKILLISLIVMVVFVGLVILFISPITKYLVEKYDVKYLGREIEMDRAYVNPFTGYLSFSGFRIYENGSDSVFLYADNVSIGVSLRKLLSKTYEISRLTINRPIVRIVQNKKDFNFSDIVTRFNSPRDTVQAADTTKEKVHFNLLNINIKDGKIVFNEGEIPINYSIIRINIESKGMRWDSDSISTQFSFASGKGTGDVNGEMSFNLKSMNYRLATVIKNLDLELLAQYLKDLANYGSFKAHLDADVRSEGNFNNVDSVILSGVITVKDFHFGKTPKEDYLSFDRLNISMKEVSPMKEKYFIDSLTLLKPYFKYERYDSLDNIETMFGKQGSNINNVQADASRFNLVLELANYIKELSNNFLRSDFLINKFAINNANFRFVDYSLGEKFDVALNPLTITADSVDKHSKRVNLYAKSGIQPFGHMNINISLDPKDSTYFDLNYHLKDFAATVLNPYLIANTSYPLDRGTIELQGNWNVRNSIIDSKNHMIIVDPRLTQKIHSKLTRWLPMRLVMALVRNNGNVIDYEIPIKGNLKDPKFKLHDVVFDILKNIFIKPVTTAYRVEVKTIETKIEKSLSLNWETRQTDLGTVERRFIKNIVNFLKDNPNAVINVQPQYYEQKEKEYILFFEAKKKYYSMMNNIKYSKKNPHYLNKEDSLKIDKMSIKDPAFIRYMNSQIKDSLAFTVQEKCARFIDPNVVETKYRQLKKAREERFLADFKEKGLDNRVKLLADKNVVPFNGFTYYKIDYEGDFPESLLKAYNKMNRLNNEPPRRKYKDERS